jgi:starch phosphorylase
LGIGDALNMTELALIASRFVNGVAMRHGEVSRGMFPDYPIRSITNGVHAATWAAPTFRDLYDRYIPGWREDPFSLRYASEIPLEDVRVAHEEAKSALLDCVRHETRHSFDPSALTLGFARRATAYKRVALIFHDLDRLTSIANSHGPLQIVFAGKSHPHDEEGKQLIREVHRAASALEGKVQVAWLPDYGMELALLLCAGCDVWLNTPIPPLEASGTSGMKAAMNGVPSLSLLDGWWVEGCIEGVTGWQIESDSLAPDEAGDDRDASHAAALYQKLGDVVAPCFYHDRNAYLQVCRQAIALNGSFFNSHRMALQYLYEAYLQR